MYCVALSRLVPKPHACSFAARAVRSLSSSATDPAARTGPTVSMDPNLRPRAANPGLPPKRLRQNAHASKYKSLGTSLSTATSPPIPSSQTNDPRHLQDLPHTTESVVPVTTARAGGDFLPPADKPLHKATAPRTNEKTNGPVGTNTVRAKEASRRNKRIHLKARKRSYLEIPPKLWSKVSATFEATSPWVQINRVPATSSLMDVLISVNKVLDMEQERGIVDLDPTQNPDAIAYTPFVEIEPTEEWVESARLVLSSHGRPTGWRIKFRNRSVANSFLHYASNHQFFCAWKPTYVEEWHEQDDDFPQVSDSIIRVENVDPTTTIDHVRHLFRRYEKCVDGPSVIRWKSNGPHHHHIYLVCFADPSWARAAVREMQGIKVINNVLRLAQYPKQIL